MTRETDVKLLPVVAEGDCRMCNGTGIVLVYPSKPYTGPPPFLLSTEMQCPDCKGDGFATAREQPAGAGAKCAKHDQWHVQDATGSWLCEACEGDKPVVQESPKGHCSKCGAGWREYTGCEMPDCNWIAASSPLAEKQHD